MAKNDIHVVALCKGTVERYIFLYDNRHRRQALRTLGRFASNPELSFTWYDAAWLSKQIQQEAAETQSAAPANWLAAKRISLRCDE